MSDPFAAFTTSLSSGKLQQAPPPKSGGTSDAKRYDFDLDSLLSMSTPISQSQSNTAPNATQFNSAQPMQPSVFDSYSVLQPQPSSSSMNQLSSEPSRLSLPVHQGMLCITFHNRRTFIDQMFRFHEHRKDPEKKEQKENLMCVLSVPFLFSIFPIVFLFSISFHLLYQQIRPKYCSHHVRKRGSAVGHGADEAH
jgi:hypothetical protein